MGREGSHIWAIFRWVIGADSAKVLWLEYCTYPMACRIEQATPGRKVLSTQHCGLFRPMARVAGAGTGNPQFVS